MTESLKKNERIFMPIDSSIADGLSVNKVGVNTFYTIKGPPPIVDKMVNRKSWIIDYTHYKESLFLFIPSKY